MARTVRPDNAGTFLRVIKAGKWFSHQTAMTSLWESLPLAYLDGCCMVLRRSAVLAVGGFCEQLPMYYNDTELSIRLIEAGFGLLETADCNSWLHHQYASSMPIKSLKGGLKMRHVVKQFVPPIVFEVKRGLASLVGRLAARAPREKTGKKLAR